MCSLDVDGESEWDRAGCDSEHRRYGELIIEFSFFCCMTIFELITPYHYPRLYTHGTRWYRQYRW